ncbi:MAG: ribosome maturation factor RimM [Actinomycetota bacterium]|nr:ribosome maturation factor RimM [Actinomycetota bacterium]
MSTTEVVVGRIGRPHGIKGELSVELRTDEPGRRFADGASLTTQTPVGGSPPSPSRLEPLTVRSTRWHKSRLLVTFEDVADRTQAEAVRGLLLVAAVATDESPEDPDEFYDHQLVGFRVVTVDGTQVGELTEIIHGRAQDLLSVRAEDGREILVPFVAQLVPRVDVPDSQVVIADLPGLLTGQQGDEDGGA